MTTRTGPSLRSRWRDWAGTGLTLTLLSVVPAGIRAQEETVSVVGLVVDATTGKAIPGAVIRLGQSDLWTVSGDAGKFELKGLTPGWQVMQVEATGYTDTGWPAEAGAGDEVAIELEPNPFQLEGFDINVMPYKTRLRRRRNLRMGGIAYVLDPDLLSKTTKRNLWDLVGDRHGFRFEGYSDYGCPLVTLYGKKTTAVVMVNERPIQLHRFLEFEPKMFAHVEVWDAVGAILAPSIRAYTQEFLDHMDRTGQRPTSNGSEFITCPKGKPGQPKQGWPIR